MTEEELGRLIRTKLYDFLLDSDYTMQVTNELAKEITSKVEKWKQ